MNQIWPLSRSLVGFSPKIITGVAIACAALISTTAAELLQNGNFSSGIAHWRTSPRLGSWNPQLNPGFPLNPNQYDYKGILVYQNLSVPGVSGKTLTLGVTLDSTYAFDSKSVAVQLDYALADGQVKRLTAWNPDGSSITEGTSSYNTTVVMPSEAVRLVRLAVSRIGENGYLVLHGISLAGTGLTPGALPAIAGVSPSAGPYYSTTNSGKVTLRGNNFGSITGQVYIGICPADLVAGTSSAPIAQPQIESWTPTQIVVRIVEPMTSGRVYVMAGSVESEGDLLFTVTSPHFLFTANNSETIMLRGQKFLQPFEVDFMNGFSSAGGVSMMLTMPIPTSPELPRLTRSGGFAVELDTSTLAAGKHAGMAQTLEDHSYARFAPFVVDVRTTSDILFSTNSDQAPVTAMKVIKQGEFTSEFTFRVIDNTGADFPQLHVVATPPVVSAASDNPNVVDTYHGNFGLRFFAKDNGTAHLIFTSADGLSRTLTVHVELPDAPRVTNASINPGVADNSGKSTNFLFWQATESLGWIGYEGMSSFSMEGQVWDSANRSATWTLPVPEGTPPGRYLFHAQAGTEGAATSFLMLDVVNAPTHGQIEGNVITIGGSGPYGHGAMGNFEWYDAATGESVGTNMINSMGTTRYLATYIPPGSYKVRWVSFGYSNSIQWYPKAATFAEAATIQVTAGSTVSNINFVVLSDPVLPSDLFAPLPVFNGGEITFAVPTGTGLTYVLEYKDSLQDETWKVALSITGNGSDMVLADPAGPATRRFYRVTVIRPNS